MDTRPTTYVFTTTKWQNINFVPALAIGSIEKLVVLVAERGGRFADLDLQNAIISARGFAEAYKQELARNGVNRQPELVIENGPVTGVGIWRRKLKTLLEASPSNARIVFSYLAGPTDTKIGVWRALDDIAAVRPDIEIQRVSYDADSRLNWADTETVQTVETCIALASWLALCGRIETDQHRQARLQRERQISQRLGLIGAARTLAFDPFHGIGQSSAPAEEAWYMRLATRLQHLSISQIAATDGCLKRAHRPDVQAFCDAFATFTAQVERAFSGTACTSAATVRPSPSACRFLSSDWFEELIYAELRKRAPQATLALDLKITPAYSDTPGGNEFAIDVAMLARNQLHIVEAKAQNPDTASQERRAWVDQTQGYRDAVVGPGGLSILALASQFAGNSELRDWARLRQVPIADGWSKIDKTLDQIAAAAAIA